MNKNIFDVVNEKFFYPLAGNDERLNFDLLNTLNKKITIYNLSLDRDRIISIFKEVLESYPKEVAQKIDLNAKFNYFIDCGWIIEERDGIKMMYQLDDNAISLLNSLDRMSDEEKTTEFTSDVTSIYNNLYFLEDKPTDTVKSIADSSKKLDEQLRGLNNKIKKSLTKLINNNKASASETLSFLFIDYENNVVSNSFHNLSDKDNPSKYINFINEQIDKALDPLTLELFIQDYIKVKYNGVSNDARVNEARNFFIDNLTNVREQFNNLPSIISQLEKNNAKVIEAARKRLFYLTNESSDFEGKVYTLLKNIEATPNYDYDEVEFKLFESKNIDKNSLYVPIKKNVTPKSKIKIKEKVDTKELEELFKKKMKKEKEYSSKGINEYILNLLGERNEISLKEQINLTKDDLLKIFMAVLYSSLNVSYEIKVEKEEINILNSTINNLIIRKKEKK